MGRRDNVSSIAEGSDPLAIQLRQARQERNITLSEMARRLGYTKGYLSGIENGKIKISTELLQRYEQELRLQTGELEELAAEFNLRNRHSNAQITAGTFVPSNIPFPRNIFFTGREHLLEEIHRRLSSIALPPRILALTGLGGIGKTQLACEYAYRYREQYQAILWINASSDHDIKRSFVEIANLLSLPENNAHDQNVTVREVQRWLDVNPGCLLIFDNVDDPRLAYEFLKHSGESHILCTTRMQALGHIAQTLELTELDIKESVHFLLRRAQIDSSQPLLSPATKLEAEKIASYLAGLPLALNHAGSYIEQTGCSLGSYLRLLSTQQKQLLETGDQLTPDYPLSVVATWTLSFNAIKKSSPAAADLLNVCAFLNPEQIFEECLEIGAAELGPNLRSVATDRFKLHQTIRELRKYSLVRTNVNTGALSIHRLVQVVIRNTLTQEQQQEWVMRVIKAINQAFPKIEVATWHLTWEVCQRHYPQVEACLTLIKGWHLLFPEVTQLMLKAGRYLQERSLYHQAAQLYQEALTLDRQQYGEKHIEVVHDLYALALLYQQERKYQLAEQQYAQIDTVLSQLNDPVLNSQIYKSHLQLLYKMKKISEYETLSQKKLPEPKELCRTTINDDDEHIIYDLGKWSTHRSHDSFSGDAHYTNQEGASFSYTFTGVGIEIISDTSNAQGKIEVSLDDLEVVTIDTLNLRNQLPQTIVYSQNNLEDTRHTLKVVVLQGAFLLDALALFRYE